MKPGLRGWLCAGGLWLLAANSAWAFPARIVVLADAAHRATLEEAVRVELAGRGAEIEIDEAPFGDDYADRTGAAIRLARAHGASAAVWVEPPAVAGTLPSVAAVDEATGSVRSAPLPRPSRQLNPRVFAVVAVSLLEELADQPAAPPSPEPAPPEPLPAAEPPAPPAPPPPTAAVRAERTVVVAASPAPGVGLDFVPFLGTSLATRGNGTRWLSFGAVGALSRELRGLEITGVVGIVRQDVRGVQIAGVAAIDGGAVTGLQLSGVFGHAGRPVEGMQLAGVANVARDDVTGVQLAGVANVAARNVRGVQLGVVNIALGDVEGVQIGLVNVSNRSTVPIGLVNVMRGGRLAVEVVASDGGLLTASLLHDAGGLQVQYRAGALPLESEPMVQFGIGLGRDFRIAGDALLALGVTVDDLVPANDLKSTGILSSLRLEGGLPVSNRLMLVAGLTANVLVTDRDSAPGLIGASTLSEDRRHDVRAFAWPGLVGGLRVR